MPDLNRSGRPSFGRPLCHEGTCNQVGAATFQDECHLRLLDGLETLRLRGHIGGKACGPFLISWRLQRGHLQFSRQRHARVARTWHDFGSDHRLFADTKSAFTSTPHRSCHSSFRVRHVKSGFGGALEREPRVICPQELLHHSALMLLYMRNTNFEEPIKPSEPQNKERPMQKFSDVPK